MLLRKGITIAVVFATGVAAGIPIGARVGLKEFMLADSQYKASLLVTNITSIKAGRPEPVVTSMEISLNDELANFGAYMESRLWWLWPELRTDDEHPIRKAVSYRLANPYEGPDLGNPANWKAGVDMQDPFVRDVVNGQVRQREFMRRVLERFGDLPRSVMRADGQNRDAGSSR